MTAETNQPAFPAVAPEDGLDGLVKLLPQMWSEVVVDTISGVHFAVSDRTFGVLERTPLKATGVVGAVRTVHDEVATGLYDALHAGGRTVQRGLQTLTRVGRGVRHPAGSMAESRAWRTTEAILNGVLGDLLEEQDNPLAIRMSVRHLGHDVPLTTEALHEVYPIPTGRLAVMVHGLVESEDAWGFGRAARDGWTYPDVLADMAVTPVLLRYNSGRHISDNALDLARLLEGLVAAWPVEVTELVLIGHSMGGLVIRGAAEAVVGTDMRWPTLVRDVVMLGSPHSGAALEKAANAGAWLMAAVPEAAPFAGVLRRRSAGIKDLRHGSVHEADWVDANPDGLRSRRPDRSGGWGGATDGSGPRVHNVAATLTRDPDHAVGRSIGDLLVRVESATARGHVWARQSSVTVIGEADHFALLNHPEVEALLRHIIQGT